MANNRFQNGSRLLFWIFSNLNYNGHSSLVQLREPIRVIVSNFVAIGQMFAEMRQFSIFKIKTDRHLTFSKITQYNGPQGKEGQSASSCKFPDGQSNCW